MAADEFGCRICLEGGGQLVSPCACSGTLARVHLSCLQRWQSQQTLARASREGCGDATKCQMCRTTYSTPPPNPSDLLALVRGRGGREIAALLRPGCLLVSRDAVLDESLLSRAPRWLRWVIRRKRAHWQRSVFLLTEFVQAAEEEEADIIIGVNVTRVKGSSDDLHQLTPEDVDDLSTSSDHDGEEQAVPRDRGDALGGGRRQRRRLVENTSSSDQEDHADDTRDISNDPGSSSEEDAVGVRVYVGGPVEPSNLTLIRVSRRVEAAADLSPSDCADVPILRADDEGESGWRATMWRQRRGRDKAFADEVVGEATAAALMERADEDDDPRIPSVHVFHGHARWSRPQLMNEIARGDWGVCLCEQADARDSWRNTGEDYWRRLFDSGRAVFAKPGEDGDG